MIGSTGHLAFRALVPVDRSPDPSVDDEIVEDPIVDGLIVDGEIVDGEMTRSPDRQIRIRLPQLTAPSRVFGHAAES